MNINLKRFVQEQTVTAPIVKGWGKYEGRKFQFKNIADGWYKLVLGDTVKILGTASPLEQFKALKNLKKYYVYAYGEEGIPTNFDTFEKMGLGQSIPVRFLNLPVYSVAQIAQWEDGRFYFFQDCTTHRSLGQKVRDIKNSNGKWAGLKGITPELGYYILLINLTSQAFREVDRLNKLVLTEEEKKRRVEQFANTLEGRLQKIIEDAGGKFIDYKNSRGKNIVVSWEIGGQKVKSQINPETFGIVSAGFCLSGADKKHTMSSIVRLAESFQEDKPLFITRFD